MCHVDFLLRRHAVFKHLQQLEAAVLDMSVLSNLPCLRDLTLHCRHGTVLDSTPELTPAQLAHLERIPLLTRLSFHGFVKVPLRDVTLPRLQELKLSAQHVEGDAQDAFEWSLPALPAGHRLRRLVINGPENFSAAGLPFETPLDLAAAAAVCEEIEVGCNSLVLLDRHGAAAADPAPGWAERHVADALLRGAAWRRIEWSFWNARRLTRRARMVADVQVRSWAGDGGLPDLDEVGLPAALRDQLLAVFGGSVALDFSDAQIHDFGANRDVPADVYTLRRVGEGAQRIES